MGMAAIRSTRERVHQALWYEGIALVLIAPAFALATGLKTQESFLLVAALSLVMMVWAAFYNTVFDEIERRRTVRVASDRPHAVRLAHAIGFEASSAVVTCPLIWALTDVTWLGAVVADLGLTVAYSAYAYLFYLGFDRVRPVRAVA